jgi:putative DNA primase/helicase
MTTREVASLVDRAKSFRTRKARRSYTDWRATLRTRGERILGDECNVLAAFRACPDLAGLLRWNVFHNRAELARAPVWRDAKQGDPWTDGDDVDAQAYLQNCEIDVRNRATVADVVERISRDAAYHPVREYLAAQEWDGVARLDTWLETYLGASGPPIYVRAVGPKFLISAVARVMEPGCQADHCLVLEGEQGTGKSSAAAILGAPWVADTLPDVTSKDAALQLDGLWIVELAELAATRGREVEHVKAFLSRRTDRYRPPYGRRAVDVPRQCVFVATTNEAHYLKDPTGNRRYWPIRCGTINRDGLRADRNQLWAEAFARYQAGAIWYLTGAEVDAATGEQRDRVLVTELESAVAEYLDRMAAQGFAEITVADVLAAIGIDRDDYERAGRFGPAVANALVSNGWHKVGTHGRGQNRRTTYRHAPKNS